MKTHELKIRDKHFQDILSGVKTCEIRFNDRDYKVGDTCLLREISGTDQDRVVKYTGEELTIGITYITKHDQKPNRIVFCFEIL